MASSGPSITGGEDLQMAVTVSKRRVLAGNAGDIDSGEAHHACRVSEYSSSLRDLKDCTHHKGTGCPPRDKLSF